jgi:tRNA U34 5-carboxymethylaminomethyl modifying GTPase MnmE/TrmE
MRSQALRAVEEADVVVLVEDGLVGGSRVVLAHTPELVVKSKCDLVIFGLPAASEAARECEAPAELELLRDPSSAGASHSHIQFQEEHRTPGNPARQEPRTPIGIHISALTGAGMADLRFELDQLCFGDGATGGAALSLNVRHLHAIEEAREALGRAVEIRSPELLALELREAIDALGGILGQVTPDDVLGRVFAGFCIGK